MDSNASPDRAIDSRNNTLRPSEIEIAAFAHRLWEDRGCPIGSPDEDWFQAENELTDQTA